MYYERILNNAFFERGRNNVILWEAQPVSNGQEVKVRFICKNSPRRQGIWLRTDQGIEVMGNLYKSISLWEDTAPKESVIKCYTKNGLLSFYNIWEGEYGRSSQSYSSGMLLEQKGNELIYSCNDYGFDTDFDKLVFSIGKL
ncbi:hypothetical protein [Numidum massiliense]|uniref:hypothetical protein n=1 Tax=Numidum massiliense TaxID=1522315 RepID=UPI0006D56DF3|nr:hypothetical protein [Numidum massiliense]